MARPKSGPPRAWAVADAIRSDILAGRMEPGSKLGFTELSAAYQVSVGVLREALIRLVDRGIVRSQSNIGFTVMGLSADNLRDLTSVRSLIEPRFARQSVLAGSMEWEAELVAAHHRLARTPAIGSEGEYPGRAWLESHAAFHLALVAGTGSDRMLEIVGRLRDEADLYRRWYSNDDDAVQLANKAADEHREIVTAATDRSADLVEELMRQHIEGSADAMLRAGAVVSVTP